MEYLLDHQERQIEEVIQTEGRPAEELYIELEAYFNHEHD